MGCSACGGKARRPLMPSRPAAQVTQRPAESQQGTDKTRQAIRNRISGLKWSNK